MRVESAVTSITWIPSEAISGMPKLPFEMGVAHYDEPPPDPRRVGVVDDRGHGHRSPRLDVVGHENDIGRAAWL